MLILRLAEKDSYDQIIEGWLISTEMDVDEQELPQPEAEEASTNAEKVCDQPSITLLEKLAVKMDKLEASMEKLTANIVEIKAN